MHLTTLLSATVFLAGSLTAAAPLEARDDPQYYVLQYSSNDCQEGTDYGFQNGLHAYPHPGVPQNFDQQPGPGGKGPVSVRVELLNGASANHISLTAYNGIQAPFVPGDDFCWQAPAGGSTWKTIDVPSL